MYVLGEILSTGQSSRFYQKLVRDKQVAVQVGAGPDERRGPSLFIVDLVVTPGKDPAEVEKLVYEELEHVKNEGVTDAELQKVRMEVKRGKVEQLEGTLYRAQNLGQNAVYYGDPNVINTGNDKLMSVTKEQIQKAARTYLMDANRTVVTTVPKPEAGGQTMSGYANQERLQSADMARQKDSRSAGLPVLPSDAGCIGIGSRPGRTLHRPQQSRAEEPRAGLERSLEGDFTAARPRRRCRTV